MSTASTASPTSLRQSLKKLDLKRTSLQSEADAIISELTAVPPPPDNPPTGPYQEPQPMGIDTPLVDKDGYPRSDVDVVRARVLRHRLAEIRTDYKECMKQVERGLELLRDSVNPEAKEQQELETFHRTQPTPKPTYDPTTQRWTVPTWNGAVVAGPGLPQPPSSTTNAPSTTAEETPSTASPSTSVTHDTTTTPRQTPIVPFAMVDGIASADSPAGQAGLQEGDWILQFGPIVQHHHQHSSSATSNNNPMAQIAELVPEIAAHQQSIVLVVLRKRSLQGGEEESEREAVTLELKPRPWGGRGMLGCHIVPYHANSED